MQKRIYFIVLILFLIFLNSMIMVVSLITFRDHYAAAESKCLTEHYVIASALLADMNALSQRRTEIAGAVGELMNVYSQYSKSRGSALAVSFEGEWIYQSTADLPQAVPERADVKNADSKRVVYVEEGAEPRLCVYGRLPEPYQDYGLFYVSDFGKNMSEWKHMKNGLFLVGMVTAAVLAGCLYVFLQIMFRPLRQISEISATIAAGNYEQRLLVQGSDEVAKMADNFNHMAQQVESHIKMLKATAEQKQQFVDNFAHELKTPLTAIYGYAEYLQRANVSKEEQFECTQYILSECRRLQNMAYELLLLAQLRQPSMEECSVAELFSQSQKTMRIKAGEKELKLFYENGEGTIYGNQELLLCLLDNLIDNAIKASSKGGTVWVSWKQTDGKTVLEVRDEGCGMEDMEISRITEAFYRVDKARSRQAGGAGLGLSICSRIAQLHQAELTFSSEPGRGTTASVVFAEK